MHTNQKVEPGPRPTGTMRVLHIATVSGPDGVLWTAAEWTADALLRRLGAYVERRAPTTLWADEASQVMDLLAAGDVETAIDLYFSRVGDRWDPERLHRQVIRPE